MYLDTDFGSETWLLAQALYAAYLVQRLGDGWLEDPAWPDLAPAACRGWAAVARAVEHLVPEARRHG